MGNLTRRLFAQAAASAVPFVARGARALGDSGGMSAGYGPMPEVANDPRIFDTAEARKMLMSRDAALMLMRNDPLVKELLMSEAMELSRPSTIDPDLFIKKSFSPMAKIAFQRQRDAQKMVDRWLDTNAKIRQGVLSTIMEKLMYG